MELTLTLALPRDEMSVPMVRRVLKQSMHALGVDDAVVADIEVALTEACTNVLDHAAQGQQYRVSAGIIGNECVIEVVDAGQGFDAGQHGFVPAAGAAESGRGIQLMRALVDRVSFTQRDEGSVVHLEKRLSWPEGALIGRLTDRSSPAPGVRTGTDPPVG